MPRKSKGLTAKEYLSYSSFGPAGLPLTGSLARDEQMTTPSPDTIQEAIIAKGRLASGTLKPGEYAKLLEIVSGNYPQSFATWILDQIANLKWLQDNGSRAKWAKSGDNAYPAELKPYFTTMPGWGEIADFIVWLDQW